MKSYTAEFVIAGTREYRYGFFKASSANAIKNLIVRDFGYCSFLKINEI